MLPFITIGQYIRFCICCEGFANDVREGAYIIVCPQWIFFKGARVYSSRSLPGREMIVWRSERGERLERGSNGRRRDGSRLRERSATFRPPSFHMGIHKAFEEGWYSFASSRPNNFITNGLSHIALYLESSNLLVTYSFFSWHKGDTLEPEIWPPWGLETTVGSIWWRSSIYYEVVYGGRVG